MFGASEISVSCLLTFNHLAGSPADTDDFFLADVCEFDFSSSNSQTTLRPQDSSKTFSHRSVPNSEKRLLINLSFRLAAYKVLESLNQLCVYFLSIRPLSSG